MALLAIGSSLVGASVVGGPLPQTTVTVTIQSSTVLVHTVIVSSTYVYVPDNPPVVYNSLSLVHSFVVQTVSCNLQGPRPSSSRFQLVTCTSINHPLSIQLHGLKGNHPTEHHAGLLAIHQGHTLSLRNQASARHMALTFTVAGLYRNQAIR